MPMELKRYALDQSPLFKLRNRKKLARLLKLDPAQLRALAKNANLLYDDFSIKKKDGGSRDVENPERRLKVVQATLAKLLGRIRPPDYLFCPVKGRSYISNAAQHRGNRVVRCLDIRKYFPSTHSRRIYWFFNSIMKCDPDIAAILAKLSCRNERLPTGSPCSPILAYFAHYDVWEKINSLCIQEGYILTVYIDDVTISAPKVDPKLVWEIKRAIHASGLRYHKEKSFNNGSSEITGVIVRGSDILAPNRQLKKIAKAKSDLNIATNKDVAEKIRSRLNGLNAQVNHIAAERISTG